MEELIKKLDEYINKESTELVNLYQNTDSYRKLRYEGMLAVLDDIKCIIHPENVAFTFECECEIEEECDEGAR